MTFNGRIYLALMIAAGLAGGFLVRAMPALGKTAVSPVFALLIVSFVIDAALMGTGRSSGRPQMSMGERFAGFGAGAVLFILVAQYL